MKWPKLGIPNFFEPYWWKKIGRNSEQVKSGIPNISEPFWCKTIGRSSEKCKVYIGTMAASEIAVTVTIAQWECCSISPNIVTIAIAIAQWEPALTDGSTYFRLSTLIFKNKGFFLKVLVSKIKVYHQNKGFWLIWYSTKLAYVIMICPSCIVVVRRWHRPALASASVHSPPCHRIQDRNFIFSMNMHMCPQYMHIKYLVILTCSF